ncbi:hypothetical protein SDC9_177918 [bioreactor metagenome]|uniref:Uncharacterized protein n=1 Tax=bioreactor metagenome TaxID=1076179 RepID=A0A645GUM4_9ZZZZ
MCFDLGYFFPVILQYEFLVQSGLTLLIKKIHQPIRAFTFGLKQSLEYQITDADEQAIGLIVPVVLEMPVDGMNIQLINS